MDTTTAGFIGLGDMGERMAMRIAATGRPLFVFDPRAEPCVRLAGVGAHVVDNALDVARSADVIGLCVVTTLQLHQIVHEMLPALDDSKTVLVHSSIPPDDVRDLARKVGATGAGLLDAPVSGSRPAADAGTLTLIVGGEESQIDRSLPTLQCYSTHIFRTGDVGTAQAMKIANNVMLHMNHLIALEALRFATSQGIDEELALRIVNESTGRSWITEEWHVIDDMLVDHPQAGTDGIYRMMSKEMWNAVVAAHPSMTPMPLTALGTQISKSSFQEREAVLSRRADQAIRRVPQPEHAR